MRKRIFMILMSIVLASTNTGFAVYANEVGSVDISENETNEVNNGDLVDEDEIIIAEESSDDYGQTGMLDDETENIIVDEGKCGDNLKYALKKSDDPFYECVLTISGTGEMDDYFTNTKPYNGKICAPWNDYKKWKNNIFKKDRNFSKKPVITKLVIEDGVESIGSYAFAGVNGIAVIGQVVIPDSVKKIENHAFYGAYLIDDVYLSENLEEISPHAFEACSALKQVYFPNSVKYIRDWAFYQDEALEEVRLPENLEVIDAYAFDGCKKLKEIYFPKSVYWLGAEAFYGCEALDVIKGGEGITRLGGFFTIYDNNKNDQHYYPDNMPKNHPEYYTAYQVFRSNRSYTINESAKIIDDYLDDVRDVYYERDPENRPSDDKTESYDGTNYCLEGKCGLNATYKLEESSDSNQNNKKYILTISGKGNIYNYSYEYPTEDNPFAYYRKTSWYPYNNNIVKVVIGDGIDDIGSEAFSGCKNLKEIVGGKDVESIRTKAFYVSNLTETKLDTTNEELKNYDWSSDNRKLSLPAEDQDNDQQSDDNNQDDSNNNPPSDNNDQNDPNNNPPSDNNNDNNSDDATDEYEPVDEQPDDDPEPEPEPVPDNETKEITVTFDANGGNVEVASKVYKVGDYYEKLPVATSNYGIFAGWYTSKDAGELVTEKTIITSTENVTLYAHWSNFDIVVNQKYDVFGLYGKDNAIKKYKVECSNGAKASINKKGVVKASKPGVVTITPLVKVNKKYVALEGVKSLTLAVVKPTVTKNITGKVGDSICLNDIVSGMPENSINKITYSIPKNCKFAELDETTNILTLKKKGSVKVTVTITNNQSNSVKYSCKVKIKK